MNKTRSFTWSRRQYVNYPRVSEGGRYRKKNTRAQKVCNWTEERSKQTGNQSIGGCLCTTGTTGPGKTGEHKKRAKRESWRWAWPQERRQRSRAVVLLVRDAGPWDLRGYSTRVSPFRFFSLFSGNAHQIKEWGMWEGNGNERQVCVCMCEMIYTFWRVASWGLKRNFLWLVKSLGSRDRMLKPWLFVTRVRPASHFDISEIFFFFFFC